MTQTTTTARDTVRNDATKYGWDMIVDFGPDMCADIFTRGTEELMFVWTKREPKRIGVGFSYRTSDGSAKEVADRSPCAIIKARRLLGADV